MIRIVVNHDVVAVPQPVADIIVVERRDAPVVIVEEKPLAIPAPKAPHVAAADTAGEAPMFEGAIQAKPLIIPPHVVPNPLVVPGVNVRSLRMAGSVIKRSYRPFCTLFWTHLRLLLDACRFLLLRPGWRSRPHGRRTVRRNVPASDFPAPTSLVRFAASSSILRRCRK
jgi:hypothetical protein